MGNRIRVAHIGNTANVAYYFSYLMKRYNVESTVYQPRIPSSAMAPIYYGYDSGNPLSIDLQFYQRDQRLESFRKIANEYDIVELHEGGGFLSPYLRFTSAKRIAHFHGSELRSKTYKKRLLRVFFQLSRFDHILLSTPDLKDLIWDKTAEVLLNPIDPLIDSIRSSDGNYVFYPTRIDEEVKGSDLVFKAWEKIQIKYPDLKLIAVRWGSDAAKYENLTKQDEHVIWLNLLNRQEYVKTLCGASIVLGQFKSNSLGLIELEAISAEKPVLSLNTLNTNQPETISDESIRILEDYNYKNEILKKQRNILLPYDHNRLSKQLFDVYCNVLETSVKR